MKVKAIISALMLMACGMASAQTKTYLNVETAPGVYKSFEVNENLKISWGEKKELPPSTGTAKRTGDIDVNWVQLWKDGPKFAEYNVGAANNKAEDYGGYYAWGGHTNKTDDSYTGSENLSGTYDTATYLWGSTWRMPTKAEFSALYENCNCTFTTQSGVKGLLCTGKGNYSSNSIFLPAAGQRKGSSDAYVGVYGYYWNSTVNGNWGCYLYFLDGAVLPTKDGGRSYLFPVRAVLAE